MRKMNEVVRRLRVTPKRTAQEGRQTCGPFGRKRAFGVGKGERGVFPQC